ncbi:Retrovirus-related Pol polyprotein from transposon TNT 1-94 [Cucumis melo var. makuwa]|uniref:Retrovirus-related Pol polyprotein from transposon TNT 1-94 n=1 Tax=Cucumis melo var. makuwa TaxID=1194695 RepID=A0A5A7VI50_CUCMM|nr:Retrovirus-related Pol polyprotein from transposon TNT 1-94 [Cucumis melo var. makuwa]
MPPEVSIYEHLFPNLYSKIKVSNLSCDVCIRAKQHRVSFPIQPYKPTHPFTLVHSDVWDPSKVTTSSEKQWFVTFIDDHTRLTWVFLISDKSKVTSIFWGFYHMWRHSSMRKLLVYEVTMVGAQPIFIIIVITQLSLPLELRHASLLVILYTNETINVFIRLLVSTLSPWMSPFLRIIFSFLLVFLKGRVKVVRVKRLIRRNLRKDAGSPTTQPTLVQDSNLLRDQGMTDTIDSHIDSKQSESDRSETTFPENIYSVDTGAVLDREGSDGGNKVIEKVTENNIREDRLENISKYDPFLDFPIALRKGTRFCTEHSIANFVSYKNLSSRFRAFTANLDSTTIPKNIHVAINAESGKLQSWGK